MSWFKRAKNKLMGHQSGALKECKPNKHVTPGTLSICAEDDCKKQICENCQIEAPNQKLYCMKCFISKPGLQ